MRHVTLSALGVTLLLAAGCPTDDAAPLDVGAGDSSPVDASLDASLPDASLPDAAADTIQDADALSDVSADAVQPDTTQDVAADAAQDAGEPGDIQVDSGDAGCPPVDCTLACEFGFATGPDGCPICACAGCSVDADCTMPCPKPVCTPAGECLCDCAGVQPTTYVCPDATEVPFCACTGAGWDCAEHPEGACPMLCHEGQTVEWPCPQGDTTVPWCQCAVASCEPVCQLDAGGWVDSCTGTLMAKADCAGCTTACAAIGSKSEGWVDGCTGQLIQWAQCAPEFQCVDSPESLCQGASCNLGAASTYTCPGGAEVPFCACEAPDAICKPVCTGAGTKDEGWTNPCTGALIKAVKCATCQVSCDAIGSKSEGWYSSCDGLISWATCGTGLWQCTDQPWTQCGANCIAVGEKLVGVDDVCCAGLVPLTEPTWDGIACTPPTCICKVCMACGDGTCQAPENPCSCPEDCPMPCDPVANTGCTGGEQCHATGGHASCGPAGTLGIGETCKPTADLCAPGLVCGAIDRCWPACFEDEACKAQSYDFCLKKDPDAPWGHCMIWE